MRPTVLIVPCFNEAQRLDVEALGAFAARDDVRLVLVDDGSTDATLARLEDVRARAPGHVEVLALPRNGGKGAAVRAGLARALERAPDCVGYFDADLATPLPEVLRMRDELERRGVDVVIGARVQRLGTDIRRRAARHYAGRVFATAAALALATPVYDTQCGAKLFRVTEALRAALAAPFASRWAFDVELLSRLLHGTGATPGLPREAFYEMPLERWTDVAGSKLRPRAMAVAALDLARIAWARRAQRRAGT